MGKRDTSINGAEKMLTAISGLSILFHCTIHLFLSQCHSGLTTIVL